MLVQNQNKNNSFILVFSIFLLFSNSLFSFALDDSLKVIRDSSNVREFDQIKVDNFKNLDEFNYTTSASDNQNILLRLFRWLWDNTLGYFFNNVDSNVLEIIVYILSLLFIIFIIRQFLKSKISAPLTSNASFNKPMDYLVKDDKISGIDFNQYLREALQNNDFKVAVRILYLMLLKNLDDSKKIIWHPGKTNHQYQNEIKEADLRNDFSKLTWIYECVWYGGFNIDKRNFNTVHKKFSEITINLGTPS